MWLSGRSMGPWVGGLGPACSHTHTHIYTYIHIHHNCTHAYKHAYSHTSIKLTHIICLSIHTHAHVSSQTQSHIGGEVNPFPSNVDAPWVCGTAALMWPLSEPGAPGTHVPF